LAALGFTFQERSGIGEFWRNPMGWPAHFLQYCGENLDYFDDEQLAHVFSQRGPYRPGNTIG
jgi:hypothetical protein